MKLKTPRSKLFTLFTLIGTVLLLISTFIPVLQLDVKEWIISVSKKFKKHHHTETFVEMNVKIQKTMKRNITSFCQANNVKMPPEKWSVQLLYNDRFNLSYYAIPKIGTTFFTQMLAVLEHGPSYAKHNLTTARQLVKYTYRKRKTFFYPDLKLENTVTIIPVRNPFSRLFSAFVDKIYLPNCIPLGLGIVAHQLRDRSRNITGLTSHEKILSLNFQDFIEYVLNSSIEKKPMSDHYYPCFKKLQSLICNTRHYIVVKQESFENDVIYVLQRIGVNKKQPEIYEAIKDLLHESRIQSNIPGIIKDTYYRARKYRQVWTGPILVQRLWHSFQIQGYISKQSSFPDRYFRHDDSTYSNVTFIVNVFLREMKKFKLSRTESAQQRRAALVGAFSRVSKMVIQRITNMYDSDFRAFGYDKTFS